MLKSIGKILKPVRQIAPVIMISMVCFLPSVSDAYVVVISPGYNGYGGYYNNGYNNGYYNNGYNNGYYNNGYYNNGYNGYYNTYPRYRGYYGGYYRDYDHGYYHGYYRGYRGRGW